MCSALAEPHLAKCAVTAALWTEYRHVWCDAIIGTPLWPLLKIVAPTEDHHTRDDIVLGSLRSV